MSEYPSITFAFEKRLKKLLDLMTARELDFIILVPGSNLSYLTGLSFELSERPILMVIPRADTPAIVLPELEAPKLEHAPYPIRPFPYGEDPGKWITSFRQVGQACGMDGRIVGVEPTGLRFLEQRLIKSGAMSAQFVSGEDCLSQIRIQKDEEEIDAIRKAVQISQVALETTIPFIKIGKTEQEISTELVINLFRAGSDVTMAFHPIVSSGPNSANPHAVPSDRQLQAGDLLVIDWGAVYQGYVADLTRTFAIGEVDPEFEKIHQVTLEANTAGIAAAGLHVPAQAVDQAARKVITDAGYGPNFFHRTGHGIGMQAHEGPYMRDGNPQQLLPGMVFTVEPGIYLPGRNGVRIEDDIVITSTGAECISDMPRELRYL